ncbi:aminoacylase-1-like [Macrosteles quadrilineatus]|uniref:aminoacylase-1-like n=1 Tax=Macrosteles quadrilineatus TaxID=74068 RepID=UPI0023E287DE|nr:aminoacylase-1-like [Macrosteles quadrilineatus]
MEHCSVGKSEVENEHPAVTNFREYLRIPSVHPDVNYDECVEFIKRQARELGLLWMVHSCVPGHPVVIVTWTGQQPELPSLLLNSHMDVVPAYPENWTHDPFAAEKDEEGNIYGRGAQDMKSIGIQYLEAIRRLKKDGVALKRTVHLSFVPDEEEGDSGMRKFVNTPEFRSLNIGCSLDEARSCPEDAFYVYYGERTIWRPVVTCRGSTGHGSAMVRDTAAAKTRVIIERFLDWRQREQDKLDTNPQLSVSDITTVNLTLLNGGVQMNVVPAEITLGFDIRLSNDNDFQEISDMLDGFCREAGEGVTIEYKSKEPMVTPTRIDDTNPWWTAFRKAADEMQEKIQWCYVWASWRPFRFPGKMDGESWPDSMASKKPRHNTTGFFPVGLR